MCTTDGVQNGSESDVDCGGDGCTRCKDGFKCNANSDCQSNLCTKIGLHGYCGSCGGPGEPCCDTDAPCGVPCGDTNLLPTNRRCRVCDDTTKTCNIIMDSIGCLNGTGLCTTPNGRCLEAGFSSASETYAYAYSACGGPGPVCSWDGLTCNFCGNKDCQSSDYCGPGIDMTTPMPTTTVCTSCESGDPGILLRIRCKL
ncbi:Secreted trypsin-like serine protease [Minicystis rosea]|nr:Secreted trypsin-like serine protease [Minicystis rosea]